MNQSIKEWHNQVKDDFSELGFLYQREDVSLNAYELSESIHKQWKNDLIRISQLARIVSLNYFEEALSHTREDYKQLIKLYLNKSRCPIIMRPDAIVHKGNLKLIEINIDSAIGGIWECDFIQSRYKNNPLYYKSHEAQFINPKFAFLKFINKFRKRVALSGRPNLALVGYADYNQFYIDQGRDICSWIKENTDFDAYFLTPETLRKEGEYITDGVRDYHMLYRDGALIHQNKKTDPMIRLLTEAYSTKTIVLSDPFDLIIEHKGILSLFNEVIDGANTIKEISHKDIRLLKKYIPWTKIFKDTSIDLLGKTISIRNLVLNNKDSFVLKKCCSHAGEHVYIGTELTNEEWNDLIIKIINNPLEHWVAQENLVSDHYKFQYFDDTYALVQKLQRYTLSPFIFDQDFGGILIRIEKNDKKRVLALPTNSEIASSGVVII
jgi:hypothetical protein